MWSVLKQATAKIFSLIKSPKSPDGTFERQTQTAGGDRLFCSRPFKWFEISRSTEEAEVFLCCPSWLEKSVGNLRRQTVAEIWNGDEAQKIRASIHDGSFRHCNGRRCPHLQMRDGPVQRVNDVSDPDLLNAIAGRLTVLA